MRAARDFTAIKAESTAFRARSCILLVLPRPGEPTRMAFVASKRSVGDAPERNRARRRMREIVRRRWPRLPHAGYLMMFIASRHTLETSHQELATELEHLLASAGALAPVVPPEA